VAVLRELYPLLFVLAFWTELGYLRELYHVGVHDRLVTAWDLRVFGQHFNLTWMPRMPAVWLSEAMHFVYFAYYPLIFVPVVAVGLIGRVDAMRDMIFRLTVTYLGCYVLYLWFPVGGPSALLPHFRGALTDGFWYQLVKTAHDSGDSLGTAFPSSHVAGSVTIALVAWRLHPAPLRDRCAGGAPLGGRAPGRRRLLPTRAFARRRQRVAGSRTRSVRHGARARRRGAVRAGHLIPA